jgi:hypothetical protein
VLELANDEAFELFKEVCWGGMPDCGVIDKHYFQRTRKQWRCKDCSHTFSITSGTIFAFHKLPLKVYLAGIDRLLKPIRAKVGRCGLSGTKPGTLLKKQIPIQAVVWDVTQPGFMEADTVAHCGDRLAGDFVWSLTMTDLYTGWTECRATWNKGADGVMTQIKAIQKALPFPLKGFDSDNGSEFLNHHLLRHFQTTNNRFSLASALRLPDFQCRTKRCTLSYELKVADFTRLTGRV